MIIKLFLSKIRIYSLFLLLIFLVHNTIAQVGIGTIKIHDSAILEIESNTKGFLPPRMSQQKMMEILNPVEGLIVFNSTVNCLFFHNGSIWVNTCTLGSAVQASISSLVCSGSGGNVTEYQGGVINDTDVLTASSGKLINVSYTGGNGQSYPIESIASTGITGLTAELASGVLEGSSSALADGSVSFIITGTPSGHGVATFAVEFLGHSECGDIDVLEESSTPATSPTQLIKANSIVNERRFGQHLQVSADNLFMVVGTESEVAGSNLGALYTYTRNASTDTWQFSNKINPPSGSTGHFGFGHNFTLTGDGQRLIASTPSGSSTSYSGEVFVYNRSGNSFVLNQTMTHPNSSLSSTAVNFGANVKVSESGNILVIAASHENVGGVTGAGRIYI